MIDNLIWILTYIRKNLLEAFVIPGLDISYWSFCITLAVVGIVITVLINSVRVSVSLNENSVKEKRYHNVLRQRERVKYEERNKLKNSGSSSMAAYDLDLFEKMLNSKD